MRTRKRRAWQFAAGVAVGVACTLLISASITDNDVAPPAFGADALAGSLGTVYTGSPFDCNAVGGGFECFQPTAAGGVTLQVRLDYRGCWEAKPNNTDEVASDANGCIADAPHPGRHRQAVAGTLQRRSRSAERHEACSRAGAARRSRFVSASQRDRRVRCAVEVHHHD